jgi:hypothetical protein
MFNTRTLVGVEIDGEEYTFSGGSGIFKHSPKVNILYIQLSKNK